MEFLINDDGDVEFSGQDLFIIFAPVMGGDNRVDACPAIILEELLKFFLGQGLHGDEVKGAFAAASVMEGKYLADQRLAG